MRSLLFVPADDERKLAKALDSGADALILDLEDSISADAKAHARERLAAFLASAPPRPRRPKLYVRVNALSTGLADDDLDAAVAHPPDGIMLPKSLGADSVEQLSVKLAAREAERGLKDGATSILALVTESAAAMFGVGSYAKSSARLEALTWGAEDLSADLGAERQRHDDGTFADVFRLARTLTLLGAIAAEVSPIDAVYPDFRDLDGLRQEATTAARDGFLGKMAIHPAQVPIINEVFTPSEAALTKARRIVDAFEAAPGAGVVAIDGRMVDQPHLAHARKILARAEAGRRR